MRIVFVGSVLSSYVALKAMLPYKEHIVGVFGLDKRYSENVSDYYPIQDFAREHSLPNFEFRNINDKNNINILRELKPDLIFVIGLSQIVSKEILQIPKYGCIGLHPTPLPKMRGRAAIPWMILLRVRESSATLFYLDENIDSGDIIAQEKYYIEETDYALDVCNKVFVALEKLIKKNLPLLLNNEAPRIPQKHSEATYLAKRTPFDGLIDWNDSSNNISRLVHAVSKPYPGAYSFYEGEKIIIWSAESIENEKYIGLPGQIVDIVESNLYIATGKGLLLIEKYEFSNFSRIKIWRKLGINVVEELINLKNRVFALEMELKKRRKSK